MAVDKRIHYRTMFGSSKNLDVVFSGDRLLAVQHTDTEQSGFLPTSEMIRRMQLSGELLQAQRALEFPGAYDSDLLGDGENIDEMLLPEFRRSRMEALDRLDAARQALKDLSEKIGISRLRAAAEKAKAGSEKAAEMAKAASTEAAGASGSAESSKQTASAGGAS